VCAFLALINFSYCHLFCIFCVIVVANDAQVKYKYDNVSNHLLQFILVIKVQDKVYQNILTISHKICTLKDCCINPICNNFLT
jgi:hypothetical protein